MTQGDVLAFALIVLATGVTAWAALLLTAFLFSERTRRAADALSVRPGRAMAIGAAVTAVSLLLGISMMNGPAAPIKVIGIVLMAATLFVSVIGNAGLASILANRLSAATPDRSGFVLLARAAGLLAASSYIPVLGWFFLFPLQLFAGVGAGLIALTSRATVREAQAQGYEL